MMLRFNTLTDLRGYIAATTPDLDQHSLQELIYGALMTLDSKTPLNQARAQVVVEILKGYQDHITRPSNNRGLYEPDCCWVDDLEELSNHIHQDYLAIRTVKDLDRLHVHYSCVADTENPLDLWVELIISYRKHGQRQN